MKSIRKIFSRNKDGNTRFEVFTDCSDLPMLRFIAVMVHNDLKQLIKSGNPPFTLLQSTWNKIHEQYLNLCSGDESVNLYTLQLKVDQMSLFVEAMKFVRECIGKGSQIPGFFSRIAISLNKLMVIMKTGESFILSPETIETELQTIRILINETTMELNELQTELAQVHEKNKGTTLTEQHFYDWAQSMSAYFKYNIQLTSLTVTEFETARKNYRKQVQSELNAQRKQK